MATWKIKLDRDGMREMLQSRDVGAEVYNLARKVVSAARADDAVNRHNIEVAMDNMLTDRYRVTVLLRHVLGTRVEAKYGSLTKAANGAGVPVNEGGRS